MATTHSFTIFADYHQVYLQDDTAPTHEPLIWDDAMVSDRVVLAEGLIALSTARNMEVPVEVFVTDGPPPFDNDAWDHAVICSITIRSGRLVILGCTDDITNAARIPLPPGTYRARALFAGLDSLSEDGLDGDDRYRVELWPGAPLLLDVLKRQPSTSP